jgi:hypothetical protein
LPIVLTAVIAQAQTFRGNLSGTITDSTGAALPEASVKLENPATGFNRTTTSSAAGEFFFAELPLGIYTITVSRPGFESRQVNNAEVAVSKTTNINVQLGVAAQQQIVEVSATSVHLETTSSDLAAVVNTKTVQDLPINGRDFRQMIKLAPGVTTATSPSVNGSRTTSNNFQIDGADNNDVMLGISAINQGGVAGIPGALLPVDAIDQFSVQTNAAADTGRNAGSNVNMVIKSGTNSLHGTVYYFNRNEALASASPTLPQGSRPQEIRNNQPGFSLGGPIIKNRTFFFLTGEIQDAIAGESILDTSPSAAWVTQAQGVLARYGIQPNPVSLNLLTIWPAASRTGPATANNYLAQDTNTYNSFNGIVKVDHRFSDKYTISARYMGGAGTQIADVGSHFKDFFQAAPMHVHNFSVVQNTIVSASIVNQVTLGVNYFMQTFQDHNLGFSAPALGLDTGTTVPGSPTITIQGFDYVGATQPAGRTDTTGHVTDNLNISAGRHQLKIGGEYRRAVLDVAYFNNVRGTFTFDGSRGPWSTDSTVNSQTKSLADFLAGQPSNSSGATINRGAPEPVYQINSGDWWVHDTFQINPQLSLNYGLRYDYYGLVHDDKGILTSFLPGKGFFTGQLYPRKPLNFAPRVGFAWSPKGYKRVVVRGGWGYYYDVQPLNPFASATAQNGAATGVAYNPGGPNPVFVLNGRNIVFAPGVPVFGGTVPVPPFGAFSVTPDYRSPVVQNFNLTVQTQLTTSTLWQIGYVGSQGRHLFVLEDINQPVAGGSGVRPLAAQYPDLAAINQLVTGANSSYSSLQTSLRQQLWRGLSANVNYTWSHAIDTASSYTTPENSYNLALDRGASTFDTRHIMTGFVSYAVPAWKRLPSRLADGWLLNSLLTFTSGSPFNITAGRNVSGTGENKDRPNLVGDPYANIPPLAGTQAVQYFNPAAFQLPANGTYGNLGRDALYGPGLGSVDFSVFKRTRITERISSEFRVEVLNIFNRNNWANPNATFTSSTFGRLSNTRYGQSAPGLGFGEPRNAQLALKLIF